jgi:hypothetical protein
MRNISRRRVAVVGLAALVFGATFLVAGYPERQGQADPLPGMVVQSGSASSSGLTIELRRAIFSGTAVDVELAVSSTDPALTGLAVVPAQAQLAAEVALSGHVVSDGRTILTFPPGAWQDGAATATLSLRRVRARDSGGKPTDLDGDWELVVQLPQGKDALAARYLEALPLATAEIAAQQVVFETLRSKSATIVHYTLPPSVLSFEPPALEVGSELVRPTRSWTDRVQSSVQFDATPDAGPLTLVFEGLAATDTSHSWTLRLALNAFDQPPPSEGVATHSLTWQLVAGSGGPQVQRVDWDHRISDVQLVVTLDGLWDPGPGGPPLARGDGASLRVGGVGLFPATAGRGAQTVITMDLPDSKPPRDLTLDGGGSTTFLPRVEVVLRP